MSAISSSLRRSQALVSQGTSLTKEKILRQGSKGCPTKWASDSMTTDEGPGLTSQAGYGGRSLQCGKDIDWGLISDMVSQTRKQRSAQKMRFTLTDKCTS